MFSLTTAASSLVLNPVLDAPRIGRRASHRRDAVAFFDLFFPEKENKNKKRAPDKRTVKKVPPPRPRSDWKAKFDKAIELYSIDEVALECSFMDDAGGCGEAIYAALDALGTHIDADEVAAMTRKLITAGGSSAAYAVESWCLDHPPAPHAESLLAIAGSYEFVSEEERVELLNNTVAYYVRDSSKLVSGDGRECVDTVEAALSFLSNDDPAEAERVAMDLIGAGGIVAVDAICDWCREHPEQPHVSLLQSIANERRSEYTSPVEV